MSIQVKPLSVLRAEQKAAEAAAQQNDADSGIPAGYEPSPIDMAHSTPQATPTPVKISIDVGPLGPVIGAAIADALKPILAALTPPPVVNDLGHGVWQPLVDAHYINPLPHAWDALDAQYKSGNIVNVMLTGPAGSGKTKFAQEFAAFYKRPFFSLECGTISDPEQILGHIIVNDGTSSYVPSSLTNAMATPGCVILLDEVNRFVSPKCGNATISILDDRRRIYLEEVDHTVHVAQGVTFFATLNEGSDYSGTDMLDAAIRSRFSRKFPLPYGAFDEEKALIALTGIDSANAKAIVNVAKELRATVEAPASLRNMRSAAEDFLSGIKMQTAITWAFGGIAPESAINIAGKNAVVSWQ